MHHVYVIEALVSALILLGNVMMWEERNLNRSARIAINITSFLLVVGTFTYTRMNWEVETYTDECWTTECVRGHWEDGWGDRVEIAGSSHSLAIVHTIVVPRRRENERHWICDEEEIRRFKCEKTRMIPRK